MDRYRIMLSAFAVAAMPLLSAPSVVAQTRTEQPANPITRTTPLPLDASPLAHYVEPKLREGSPDAIERSDFEQAKTYASRVAGVTPKPDESSSRDAVKSGDKAQGEAKHGQAQRPVGTPP